MSQIQAILDADLHAFVDGEADEALKARVRDYLNGNLEAGRRVAAWSLQNDALRDAFPLPQAVRQVQSAAPAVSPAQKRRRYGDLINVGLAFLSGIALALMFYVIMMVQTHGPIF